MARIALADRDSTFLGLLATALTAEGAEVETHSSGPAALEAMGRHMPDMLVCDVDLPLMDGMEVLKRLRGRSHLPIMLVSAQHEEIDELLAFRLGADDYQKKSIPRRILVARIHAVLNRATQVRSTAPEMTVESGSLRIDPARHVVAWKGAPVSLTMTEFLLLKYLATEPGHVRSREQLLRAAEIARSCAEDRTVDSHIKRLRRKMRGVDPGFAAIQTLYGVGYRYQEV